MSAIPLSTLATSRRWQTNFLAVLPTVQSHARVRFRHLRACHKAEATAEAVAQACVSYATLVRQKKLARVYPSNIATFAVCAVKAGRHVGGHQNCRDVLNPLTRQEKGIVVSSLTPWDATQGSWQEVVLENRHFSPADVAAFRIDFQSWLKRWPARHRQIIAALAAGSTTTNVALQFRVSLGRISQLRAAYRQSWGRFQGQASLAA